VAAQPQGPAPERPQEPDNLIVDRLAQHRIGRIEAFHQDKPKVMTLAADEFAICAPLAGAGQRVAVAS
jgi:hypothetical protein